jgi:ornithine cyclodeaminase
MSHDNRPQPPLWIVEEDVRQLVSLNDAIDALAAGLVLEARGEAGNVDKALGQWNASSMHALGAMMPLRGYVAFKTWANTPRGAAAVLSLYSATDGALLALMEASAIGTLRTAAISGLATRQLASDDADEMALIGTGMQSPVQMAAIAAVRPLKRIRVFSPTPEKRKAFLARAEAMMGCEIVEAGSVAEAVAGAPIITLATRAREPFLTAAMVGRGAHVNAPGAILPGNAEFHQDLFDRAGLVVVDNKRNAAKASREFGERYGADAARWGDVHTLGEILDAGIGRAEGSDVTLFKPMGMGLSDLAVAALVYERATGAGLGTPLPVGTRAAPRWTAFEQQPQTMVG